MRPMLAMSCLALSTLGSLPLLALAPDVGGAPGAGLSLPIQCEIGVSCEVQNLVDRDPGPGARDFRCGSLTYEGHNGVDFRLPDLRAQKAGVAVLAAADGTVSRLRDGVADISVKTTGLEAVKGQECGNGLVIDHGGGLVTQYCHMRQGSLVVKAGQAIKRGQPLGQVGLSGQTEYPHLHFTVRRDNEVVDPFAPAPGAAGACSSGGGLWTAAAAGKLAYRPRAVLNKGFAAGPAGMAEVEAGNLPTPGAATPLVAYVRSIGLKVGDQARLTLRGPDGSVVSVNEVAPLTSAKAQYVLFTGKKAPAGGWPRGRYEGRYVVNNAGATVVDTTWSITI
ncbi:M23 family metallopeptidase [Caulobacter sp. ErkDOM-E]|uniref:M23 family metallopeptidase n=1 Tax=Caulobacter sp. ErkDOM-E TaxID=3402778 RepID=UPI003AF89325